MLYRGTLAFYVAIIFQTTEYIIYNAKDNYAEVFLLPVSLNSTRVSTLFHSKTLRWSFAIMGPRFIDSVLI